MPRSNAYNKSLQLTGTSLRGLWTAEFELQMVVAGLLLTSLGSAWWLVATTPRDIAFAAVTTTRRRAGLNFEILIGLPSPAPGVRSRA